MSANDRNTHQQSSKSDTIKPTAPANDSNQKSGGPSSRQQSAEAKPGRAPDAGAPAAGKDSAGLKSQPSK
ncbi:hypothetical protein [Pseudomarimonas salicorniae]|uniref:Uncharacterized protein n=1 Tax=Pseudomarimonas salicorniae TaxID=2933270 RepID=A0ABT0GMU9_9GAMM|nr:hypothetical protein [Lysobacter sp. CAU 1642]MCK7595320.1 hypothetical protein [Lysobacter sp. CAU 1642]